MKRHKANGFTLIEVLIALAILSIALTAVVKATSQNIKDTLYIQQKTMALWVGSNIINQIRAGIIKPSETTTDNKQELLNQEWPYHISIQTTANPKIKQVNVNVYNPENSVQLIHLESYLYAQ